MFVGVVGAVAAVPYICCCGQGGHCGCHGQGGGTGDDNVFVQRNS